MAEINKYYLSKVAKKQCRIIKYRFRINVFLNTNNGENCCSRRYTAPPLRLVHIRARRRNNQKLF